MGILYVMTELTPWDKGSKCEGVPSARDEEGNPKGVLGANHRAELQPPENKEKAQRIELQVCRLGSNTPIAEAEVLFLPESFSWRAVPKADRSRLLNDEELLYRAYGRRVLTNTDGRCSVSRQLYRRTVIGRCRELYGRVKIVSRQKQPILFLRPDRTLRVRVFDALGKPARGVLVKFAELNEDPSSVIQAGTTDTHGNIVVKHVQTRAPRKGEEQLVLYGAPLGGETERKSFDVLNPPVEPIELTLPPTGTVEFRFQEASGAPLDPSFSLNRSVVLSVFDRKPTLAAARRSESLQPQFNANGTLLIRRIVVGRYIAVKMLWMLREPLVVAGPSLQGENITIPVRLDPSTVIFTARLRDGSGKPLANEVVRFAYVVSDRREELLVRSNHAGRIRVHACHLSKDATARLTIYCGERSPIPRRFIQLKNEWVTRPGINELGDLTLERVPLLLSGRVIFPEGAKEKRLAWMPETQNNTGWTWVRDHNLRTIWKDDGRFEVRGVVAPNVALRLKFQRNRFLPLDPFQFRAGDRDVEIRMQTTRALRAGFIVDAKTPWRDFEFNLVPEGSRKRPDSKDTPEAFAQELLPRQDGPSRLVCTKAGLTDGEFQLSVSCRGSGHVVTIVDGLTVRGSELIGEDRLGAIDLRGRARSVRLGIRGLDGRLIEDQRAWLLLHIPTEGKWHGLRMNSKRVRIAITRPLELRALVPGFALAVADGVNSDYEVRLQKEAPVVRLRVNCEGGIPENVEMQAEVQPGEAGMASQLRMGHRIANINVRRLFQATKTVATDGSVTLRPVLLGEHALRLVLTLKSGRRREVLTDFKPREIVVGANPDPMPIAVTVPQTSIARAIRNSSR